MKNSYQLQNLTHRYNNNEIQQNISNKLQITDIADD